MVMYFGEVLVIGAGLSGAVIGRTLAEAGIRVEVVDERSHVAGNCHTERDGDSGVMVHVHGPHIFHTDNEEVWSFVNEHANFRPFVLRMKATSDGQVYSLPVNLHTINQLFGQHFNPTQAEAFVQTKRIPCADIQSFEEFALAELGREIYEAFFYDYPVKHWGVSPQLLPASVIKRLPIRYNYDDNYFSHKFQGIPDEGYTAMVESILDHPLITVRLGTRVSRDEVSSSRWTFYSGTLDGWFDYRYGMLRYRTLEFKNEIHKGDFQGCAVMSYPDQSVEYARVIEHKHFLPHESYAKTVVSYQFARDAEKNDIPYYPMRLVGDKSALSDYVALADAEPATTFVGRLGTYRYLDMDVTIREALVTARRFLDERESGSAHQSFYFDPLTSGERA